jgi:tRNA1(Val) A37 N6-methylase TrmN6
MSLTASAGFTNLMAAALMRDFRSLSAKHAEKYRPIDPELLSSVLVRLSDDWSKSKSVGLGAGNGVALFITAESDFAKVIGVELSSKLVKAGVANIALMKLANVTLI